MLMSYPTIMMNNFTAGHGYSSIQGQQMTPDPNTVKYPYSLSACYILYVVFLRK